MKFSKCLVCVLVAIFLLGCDLAGKSDAQESADLNNRSADVIVVGAGISGLSAAIEAAEAGLSVLVIDMASVFGGHGVVAGGVLNIPVTPDQQAKGIQDSHELAIRDFKEWGEDVNEPWVDYYVKHARTEIYDWLTGMGIHFFEVVQPAGNSVPRVHVPEGFGLSLVTAIYKKALAEESISMLWNTRADDLIVHDGRIVGVNASNTRSGKQTNYRAGAVIIATGGFQSNIQMVLENWPDYLQKPSRILAGSGIHSMGSGLDLARSVGAQLYNLDHQWNYITGVANPSFKEGDKGLSYFPFPGKPRYDIWVNDQGKRFANECQSPKYSLPRVLEQPDQRYWSVFDHQNKSNMTISGPGWTRERLEKEIYQNTDIAKVADSIAELAEKMGVPVSVLQQTVGSYNQQIAEKVDRDFGRFGLESVEVEGDCGDPIALTEPPYYAVRLFPLARKSMGGIKIDLQTRVLSESGQIIPGLYAVGEASGLAGINGKAGLEGTFLGPSIVTGRQAGRTVGQEIAAGVEQVDIEPELFSIHAMQEGEIDCSGCHRLEDQVQQQNSGYDHFRFVHNLVLERELPCQACHVNLFPYNPSSHVWSQEVAVNTCATCHGGGD